MAYFSRPKDIRVGVIGYGGAFNMGKAHMDGMKQAGMSPFAVCEIDPARLEVAQEDFPGIETYGDLDAMLRQSDVNLIVHITPHNLHFPLAAKCVEAGKHVVTEKPFVVTTSEADRLIKLAEKHDVMVSTYHNRHWDGWVLRAQDQIVNKGAIGDVHRVELRMGGYGMPRDWWRTSRSISGGIMYDWGVHLLEYALQLIPGRMTEVSGFRHEGYWEKQSPKKFKWRGDMNEDEGTAIVRFDSGAVLRLTISQIDPEPKSPLVAFGTKGSYSINGFWGGDDTPGWTTRIANAKGKIIEKSGKHPKSRGDLFYKNIAQYLCGNEDLIITPQWARRPIHILDLAMQSAAKGKAMKAKHG